MRRSRGERFSGACKRPETGHLMPAINIPGHWEGSAALGRPRGGSPHPIAAGRCEGLPLSLLGAGRAEEGRGEGIRRGENLFANGGSRGAAGRFSAGVPSLHDKSASAQKGEQRPCSGPLSKVDYTGAGGAGQL